MGRLASLVLASVVLASFGCQPLYGNKPERLKNPDKKRKPPEPESEVVQVRYIEECSANFREEVRNLNRDMAAASRFVGDGDTALDQVRRAKDPASQAELIKVSIEKYRNALLKDPFNEEATLKLAVAYDMVYRKGCALQMLKRLAALQANPKFQKKAARAADAVADNATWFKGYRKDAISAVGR